MSVIDRQHRRNSGVNAMYVEQGVSDYNGEAHVDGVYGIPNIVQGVRDGTIDTSYDGVDLNLEQAVRLMKEYKDGNISEKNRVKALEALQFFDKQNPGVLQANMKRIRAEEAAANEAPAEDAPDETAGDFRKTGEGTAVIEPVNALDAAVGVGELGLTMISGAVGEIAGGLIALGQGAFTDATVDDMANTVNAVSDAFTFTPKTYAGQKILQGIGIPLTYLDNGARDLSTYLASDNPLAATAIYSTIMGGTELLGLKGVSKLKPGQAVKVREAKVNQIASDMGINLTQSKLPGDVVKAANQMAPGTRHANAQQLQMDLYDARRQSRAHLQTRVEAARSVDASVKASDVANFGKSAEALLRAEGYDLASMDAVRTILDDFKDIKNVSPLEGRRAAAQAEQSSIILPNSVTNNLAKAAKSTEASLNEIWTLRNRIEKSMVAESRVQGLPDGINQNMALRLLDRKLDEFLDFQYVNDMVSGDVVAIDAWRAADAARVHHNRRFNADRDIKKLVDLDATPEQITAYIRGSSTVSPAKQSASVIRRIKDILGNDHPSVQGIKQDYLFEIVEPLMTDTPGPNFTKFIQNYDNIVRNNPSIVKELGLNMGQLEDLRNFAVVADRLPNKGRMITTQAIATAISRLWVGHSIAKQGMKVSIFARVLGALFGRDTVSAKRILSEATGIKYGEAAIAKGSQAAANVAQAAIVADITEAEEKRRRRAGE
ncbi:hypothetical protein [Eudoraea sp.]|uniref:hypothetical protein n=1 Tax=Eudoraea sp. TaxID=1979955 RepID=UPI003C74BF20